MFKKFFISFILGASVLCAQTQEQTGDNQPAEETVTVTLKFFKWAYSNAMTIPNIGGGVSTVRASKNKTPEVFYKVGDKYKRLSVSGGSISSSISYKGPQTMQFYKEEARVSDEGTTTVYREMAKMTIPLGIEELFVMMFETGQTVKFYPINVSPKTLPKERIAVVNMTSQRIALLVGGEPKLLPSGGHAIFKPKQKKATSVDMQIARMIDRKWKPVYQNKISTPENARCIVLLYDPTNKKTPRFNVQVLSL